MWNKKHTFHLIAPRFFALGATRIFSETVVPSDRPRLVPDLIVLLAPEMADGPAGVFRMARARRVLRLFRFVQIVRLWKTLQAFMSSLEKLGLPQTEAT